MTTSTGLARITAWQRWCLQNQELTGKTLWELYGAAAWVDPVPPPRELHLSKPPKVGMDYLLRNGPRNADPPLVDVSKGQAFPLVLCRCSF